MIFVVFTLFLSVSLSGTLLYFTFDLNVSKSLGPDIFHLCFCLQTLRTFCGRWFVLVYFSTFFPILSGQQNIISRPSCLDFLHSFSSKLCCEIPFLLPVNIFFNFVSFYLSFTSPPFFSSELYFSYAFCNASHIDFPAGLCNHTRVLQFHTNDSHAWEWHCSTLSFLCS